MLKALLVGQLSWNLPLFFGLLIAAMLYTLYTKCWTKGRLLSIQTALFTLGTILFYMLIGSPLQTLSHLSLSLHMLQMSLLYFFVPPLLVLGLPILAEKNSSQLALRIPAKLSLYVFAALFFIYHLPSALTYFSLHTSFRMTYEILLLVLAFFMWWPLTNNTFPKKRQFALQSGMVLMPACLLLIVTAFMNAGSNPLLTNLAAPLCLPADAPFKPLPAPFNTSFDQAAAGFFMLALHKFAIILTFRFGKLLYR